MLNVQMKQIIMSHFSIHMYQSIKQLKDFIPKYKEIKNIYRSTKELKNIYPKISNEIKNQIKE